MTTVEHGEHGRTVQRMFGRIAHGYDRANRWMSLGIDRRWRRAAVAALVPESSGPAPTILDLCAGTLDSSLEIHRRHPAAEVVAGDFSGEMLEVGRGKLVGPAAERIRPVTMDAHEIPLPSGSVDAIFCAFGIRNLADLPRATAEQARCLRPGGRLTVLEFFRPQALRTRIFHGVYNHTVLPALGFLATGDLAAYVYLSRSIGGFVTIEDYAELLRHHGFSDVRIEPLTLGIAAVVRATLRAREAA